MFCICWNKSWYSVEEGKTKDDGGREVLFDTAIREQVASTMATSSNKDVRTERGRMPVVAVAAFVRNWWLISSATRAAKSTFPFVPAKQNGGSASIKMLTEQHWGNRLS